MVTAINEHEGLLLYSGINKEGKEVHITELSLNCFISLNTPEQRLFSGLLDKLNAFKLRIDTYIIKAGYNNPRSKAFWAHAPITYRIRYISRMK